MEHPTEGIGEYTDEIQFGKVSILRKYPVFGSNFAGN